MFLKSSAFADPISEPARVNITSQSGFFFSPIVAKVGDGGTKLEITSEDDM